MGDVACLASLVRFGVSGGQDVQVIDEAADSSVKRSPLSRCRSRE
jgi:hypothetical protein